MALTSADRASGIYGLFRLDSGPIHPGDARFLGMSPEPKPTSFIVNGVDVNDVAAVNIFAEAGATTVLVGHIEEVEDLAARLMLRREVAPAQLAQAALARFGEQLPNEMTGEWSLLHRAADSRLTMVMSAARRDPILYAVAGSRVAVAPDVFRLAKLDWVGTDLDEAGLLCIMGRANVRSGGARRTMLRSVTQMLPGSTVTIGPDGRIAEQSVQALQSQPRWEGSFDDAVAASEQLLRKIMHDRLARSARPVSLLSGGLDSSLLAWLAAEESKSDQKPRCITSAAPPGSGLPDETAYAELVADHLHLPIVHVSPARSANIYRPEDKILAGMNGPPISNRHCLTEAFQIAARDVGATTLIDGCYGEMTITARLPALALRYRMRALAVKARNALFRPPQDETGFTPFHVHVAPHRLTRLPESIIQMQAEPATLVNVPAPGDLLGYIGGAQKSLGQRGNEFYPGAIRMDQPFRDVRLLRLFAGFPVKMLLTNGHDRPVVRQMLAGRLPDSIRLRRRGMPASPDHFARLQRQAEDARKRIAEFRKAEVDEWLDLDWLDGALARVAQHGASDHDDANRVQMTAVAAEFLTWWRTRF